MSVFALVLILGLRRQGCDIKIVPEPPIMMLI